MTPPYRAYPAPAPPAPALVVRTVPEYLVPERSGLGTTWFSNVKRVGDWILPRNFRSFSFMGSVELDLTNARMGEGTSEIELRCIFSSVEIKVPADIRVEIEVDGVMNSCETEEVGDVGIPSPDAPLLRIIGSAYMGSVEVKIIGTPKASWKEKVKSTWDFFYS